MSSGTFPHFSHIHLCLCDSRGSPCNSTRLERIVLSQPQSPSSSQLLSSYIPSAADVRDLSRRFRTNPSLMPYIHSQAPPPQPHPQALPPSIPPPSPASLNPAPKPCLPQPRPQAQPPSTPPPTPPPFSLQSMSRAEEISARVGQTESTTCHSPWNVEATCHMCSTLQERRKKKGRNTTRKKKEKRKGQSVH